MSAPLRICDPHVHLWDLSTGLYPGLETPSTGYIGENAAIARSYLLPEPLAEPLTAPNPGLDLVAAVHVEAFPIDPLRELAHLDGVAATAPLPLGLVAGVDLTAPDLSAPIDAWPRTRRSGASARS